MILEEFLAINAKQRVERGDIGMCIDRDGTSTMTLESVSTHISCW